MHGERPGPDCASYGCSRGARFYRMGSVLRKYRLRFEPPVPLIRTGDNETDIIANTAKFTKVIEDVVRRYPDQWLWVHRRWKTRPPGHPPLY
jgi:lauroyl/myristoyl acyltransferase